MSRNGKSKMTRRVDAVEQEEKQLKEIVNNNAIYMGSALAQHDKNIEMLLNGLGEIGDDLDGMDEEIKELKSSAAENEKLLEDAKRSMGKCINMMQEENERMRRKNAENRRKAREAEQDAFAARVACGVLVGAVVMLGVAWSIGVKADAAEGVPAVVISDYDAEDFENQKIDAALKARAVSVGACKVTFYDCCEKCCGKTDGITYTGVQATPEVTVAVDPSVIPLGSDVLIQWEDGTEQWCRADDVGAAVTGNSIDLCVDTHEEALRRGLHTAQVWWVDADGELH